MKRIFLLAAIAATAAVSCTKTNTTSVSADNQVSFTATMPAVTKATTPFTPGNKATIIVVAQEL